MQIRGIISGLVALLAIAAVFVAAWWTVSRDPKLPGKSAPKAPASITLNEAQLNVITLNSESLARLAIRTAAIERKSVQRNRVFGGDVVVPPGQSIIVSAPVSGVLKAPANGAPVVGHAVRKQSPVFELLPLLTPEGRAALATSLVDAAGQLKSAAARRDAEQINYDRAKRLFDSDAGSRRAVDDAQAQLRLAEETYAAALARQTTLQQLLGDANHGTASLLTLESPRDGIVRAVHAMPSQQVPAGTALFEVVDLSQAWVRVPIFSGDDEQLDDDSPALVSKLTAKLGATVFEAKKIDAPPSANSLAATVDFFYAFENTDNRFRPGERVAVQLALRDEHDSLIVPWSAVVYDINGGTWVYQRTSELTFQRQRVTIRYVRNEVAVLERGPPAGTVVVTAGAAELFGTETGFTK